MMAETPALLVPASTVPVAPEIGGVLRYDDEMSHTDLDRIVTTGAHVALACLIRLDRMHNVLAELTKEPSLVVCEVAGRRCHGRKGRRETPEPLTDRSLLCGLFGSERGVTDKPVVSGLRPP